MSRLIILAFLTACCAGAQDGVFIRDPQAVTLGSVEDSYLVLRHPLVRASVPKAKGIVLINRPTHSELSFPTGRVELKESTTDTRWERVIHIILDEPLQDSSSLVVVLGGRVFWDIGGVPVGHNQWIPGGWISLRLVSRDEPKRVLRDAMRVFGLEEQQVLDLRLTEEELARVPTVKGQLSSEEVSELIVLLTNRKRRALHDFIAGTVVVHTSPKTLYATAAAPGS